MSIRLSGAQVTRVREALQQRQDNLGPAGRHEAIEELVEDILNIVLPLPKVGPSDTGR
jgi:hypothetical protein